MAVGARITSENLSGKTATVTFIPYTGTTSGTTQNLGTKVIPFNNITSHPYGDYNLYFAEYDYTYTLTIPQPDLSIQSYVYVAKMVGSDNFGVGMLNFNDFTAEIIDLNIDSTLYYCNNIYELTNSGYMYEFRDEDTEDERIVIFTNSSNVEIGRYTGTTSSRSASTLEGRWVTYEDVDNGVLTYSDGVSVYTYTWNPETHYIDIEWDYDATTSDNTFIIKKREIGQWTYNGNGSSYIVNPTDGTTSLFKTWTEGTWVRHQMVPSSDTIHVLTEAQDNVSGNTYTNYEIYNSTGTILETISLTGATYTSYDGIFHGANKHTIVFYNYNDVNVAYKIVHYNGDTQTLIETSHNRGTEYDSIYMDGDRNFWTSSTDRNNGAIIIQLSDSSNGTNYGDEVTFCDIMYMFNNQTSFTTYTFANDDSGKRISIYGQLSDIYRVGCVNGDGVASVLTIMSGSTRIESLNINAVDVTQWNYYNLGNKALYQIWTNDGNNVTYKYINELGVVTDTLDNYSLITGYASSADNQGQNAYIGIQSEGDIGFYVYSGSTGFTETDYYGTTYTPSTYASDTFKENTEMVLFTGGQLDFRILSSTGITQEFSFPEYGEYSINVGKTKFMFVYQDSNDSDTVKIRLYNFAGTLLNSATTTWTNWSDTRGVNERFIVMNNDVNGVAEIYLVSEDNITSLTFQNTSSDTELNDYVYNDD
jgi:hypothetical protein